MLIMLTPAKKKKLISSLKLYRKRFLSNRVQNLDESGTRLMINSLLEGILGYASIDEIKTEYMIKGTYADYVIQLGGVRHFLVEVKALSLTLSDKHLRQAKHYGADEGIDWIVLTNGKVLDLYRVLFLKPVESIRVFSIDLSDASQIKVAAEFLQFMHKDSVKKKGLNSLWSKHVALDPKLVASLLYEKTVVNYLKRTLKRKSKSKISDHEVVNSLNRIIAEKIDLSELKQVRISKRISKKSREKNPTNMQISSATAVV